jgi:hypothetical protein
MSISSSTRKAGPYSGNGSTTQFPFSFKVFSASDVLVVRTDPAGVESNLVLGADYTVALNADQDANPGGAITATTAPATGYLITITSQVQNLQPVTLTNQGAFYPKVINDALDRATIQIQQMAEQVSRAIKVQISSSISPDALISQLETDAANAAAAASAASSSAATAGAKLAEFKGVYYGPYASDPAVDPNGAAPGAGDTYYNTATKLLMVFDGTTWAPAIQHAVLADSATNLTGTSTSNIPTSALGSGTANSTTFLRGDRTFQTIATMTATTGGLVPTPPNDVNQVLRGDGTFGTAAAVGRLVNIVRITTAGSGTYNKPSNVNRLLIRAVGGGGGGGGGGSGNSTGGGGGGGGGYGELWIPSPATSYSYTVGAGGAGGAANSNGANGGATTIAGISAGGGAYGNAGSGGGVGGSGGTATGGSINVRGDYGAFGNTSNLGGSGGDSPVFGGSGLGGSVAVGSNGVFGGGGGGGGGGGYYNGGTGGTGYIEIWEFE